MKRTHKPFLLFWTLTTFFCSYFLPQKNYAQEVEFSQYYAAPQYLNPAMIGFSTAPRVVANFRHQYSSFNNPYVTFGAAYDQHFDNINSSIGVSILADRAANGLLNTYTINAAYAYQLWLTRKVLLKTGVQLGYFQQNINWDELVFGDMLNPLTGNTGNATTEILERNNAIRRVNAAAGITAYTERFYVGVSFKNLTQPNLNFDDLTPDSKNKLAVRSNFHIGNVYYFGKIIKDKPRLYISPNFMLAHQYDFWQVNVGAQAGKGLLYGGLWFRHTIKNSDALIFLVGVQSGVFKVGYSYDATLSGIGTAAGAHELSLQVDMGKDRYFQKQQRKKNMAACPEIFKP